MPFTPITADYVVTSVLKPADVIRKDFETITVVTSDGKTNTGLLVEQTDESVKLRIADRNGQQVTFSADTIEEIVDGEPSIMPAGIVNQPGSRQQFLDLVRYLLEVRDGGVRAAATLRPPPGLTSLPTVTESPFAVGTATVLDHEWIRSVAGGAAVG